jgi:hypothetical protein
VHRRRSLGGPYLFIVFATILGQASFWIRQNLHRLARDRRDERQSWLFLKGMETLPSVVLVVRWPWAGMLVWFVGGMCNDLIDALNGWRMPVNRLTKNPNYCTIGPETRLWRLGDVLRSGNRRWSAEDLLLGVGTWWFAAQLWMARS